MGNDLAKSERAASAAHAQRYFAAQAAGYEAASRRGLWSFLRGLETSAVLRLSRVRVGEKILDAGSGAGHYTGALKAAGADVTALDREPEMLAAVATHLGVPTICGDLLTVRLEPTFDKIVCAGVLEFVADREAALRNLVTALRPDGPREIVILVVARSVGGMGYWLTRRINGISMPLTSRPGLDRLAASAGLRVKEAVRAGYNWVARVGPIQ